MSKAKKRNPSQPKPAAKTKRSGWAPLAAAVLLVAAIFAGTLLIQNNNQAVVSAAGADLPDEISVEQAFQKREAGSFILDVRQPEEWEEYHLTGSTLIPLDELAERVDELPRDQEIVVVCRSGNRSQAGRDILVEADFTQVTSMAGGLKEWKTAGYSTVSGQ